MNVLRKKYLIEGKVLDCIPDLETLKEGTEVVTVLVVEKNSEDDKSGVKLDKNTSGSDNDEEESSGKGKK